MTWYEIALIVFASLVIFNFGYWMGLEGERKNTRPTIVTKNNWLCPDCLKNGDKIQYSFTNKQNLAQIKDQHMYEFHSNLALWDDQK